MTNTYYLWILDNGHGADTPGKRSSKLEDGRILMEYEFNRDIVNRLIEKLKKTTVQYVNLVTEQNDVSLAERVNRANALKSNLTKVYVSVHSNAQAISAGWGSASGIETFCYRLNTTSDMIARCFQSHLVEKTAWRNRGVKEANFYVLRNTNMAAVLTENGFYTNKEECKNLLSAEYREKIAQAHFNAILEIESGKLL